MYKILVEQGQGFSDAGMPPYSCETPEEAADEVMRLQAENGRCYAAQLIDEQPAQ